MCKLVYQTPTKSYQSQIPVAFSIPGHVTTRLRLATVQFLFQVVGLESRGGVVLSCHKTREMTSISDCPLFLHEFI